MSEQHVILCPGQGAQRAGMGRAWAEASDAAAQTFVAADAALGDRLGKPLSALCFEGPAATLDRTDAAQPAIFTVSVACRQALQAEAQEGRAAPLAGTPAGAAGLSLGEYTALHLAGAIGFQDCLELVALRGRAMQEAAEASDGGMVALIGADQAQAEALCAEASTGADSTLVPANFNAPGQIVLSGHAAACDRAAAAAAETGLRATRLAVAGAFHSPLMAPAAERLAEALDQTPVSPPACPVLSNVTGLPHGAGEDDPDAIAASIRARLVEQLTAPVRWAACCAWLLEHAPGQPHELAPGKTLAGLMRRIHKPTKVITHDEPGI